MEIKRYIVNKNSFVASGMEKGRSILVFAPLCYSFTLAAEALKLKGLVNGHMLINDTDIKEE